MEIQLPIEIDNILKEIRSDNTSGAAELAKNAAECYNLLLDEIDPASAEQLKKYIIATSQKLIQTQPAMAPLFNLANDILFGIDGVVELDLIRQEANRIVNDFVANLKHSEEQLTKNTLELVQDRSVIMNYSYSSTVLNALLQARKAGHTVEVICSESRPVCEGVNLANRLAQEGIKVTLVVDSTLFSLISKADIIIVGADSISRDGVVNKIGTSALAVAAQEYGIGFYSLCGSQKFLPGEYKIDLEDPKDPLEILSEPIENVEVKNLYFDMTPLDYVTGVVTEEGVIKADELLTRLEGLKVHPSLIL